MRNLAAEFGLSATIVQSVIKGLQDEGLVTSLRGSGTTIVTKAFDTDQVYLFVGARFLKEGAVEIRDESLIGMTDRLAELGAFTVSLPNREALTQTSLDTILRCKGLYGNLYDPIAKQRLHPPLPMPTVSFGEHADPEIDDCVRWDDFGGGRAATQHLLSLGHRSITFVGEHGDRPHWAADRAAGYREAMTQAGWGHRIRSFPWGDRIDYSKLSEYATEAARTLAAHTMPDAVVACNDEVAVALLKELMAIGVPLSAWPAILGFDDVGVFAGQEIASVRPDRRAVGRAGADLLWRRANGQLQGPPVTVEVPMTIVPRLSSQPGWAYRLHRLVSGFPFEIEPVPSEFPFPHP